MQTTVCRGVESAGDASNGVNVPNGVGGRCLANRDLRVLGRLTSTPVGEAEQPEIDIPFEGHRRLCDREPRSP